MDRICSRWLSDNCLWPTALFPDKRIKFNFGWDNWIKFNFLIWLCGPLLGVLTNQISEKSLPYSSNSWEETWITEAHSLHLYNMSSCHGSIRVHLRERPVWPDYIEELTDFNWFPMWLSLHHIIFSPSLYYLSVSASCTWLIHVADKLHRRDS